MGNFEQDQQVWQQLLSNKGKYISLGTRKRDGSVVRTPVWFVVEGSDLIVTTEGSSGKAKRMRNYPEINLADCDMRGRIGGALVTAAAEILPVSVNAEKEKLFVHKFKLMYKLMSMRGRKNAGRVFIRVSRDGFASHV
jgi:PPOX class probable F420-dependent enzyme